MKKYLVTDGTGFPHVARIAGALRDMEAGQELPREPLEFSAPGHVCPEAANRSPGEARRWLEAVCSAKRAQGAWLSERMEERLMQAVRIWAEALAGVRKTAPGARPGEVQEMGREEEQGMILSPGRAGRFLEQLIEIALRMERLGALGIVHGALPLDCAGGTEPEALEICCSCGMSVRFADRESGNVRETVTPEDAAFLAAFGMDRDSLSGEYQICRIGTDGGEPPLRLLLAKERETGRAPEGGEEEAEQDGAWIWVLETNIDDVTGEQLGYAIGLLMKAGARDASAIPVLMKKSRPAFLLQVICTEEKVEELEGLIFRETTSIGLRKYREKRRVLERRFEQVETSWGPVQYKVCEHHGELYYYPEYEDVAAICRRTGKSFQEILRALRKK